MESTLAILGCGKLGTAILSGILTSVVNENDSKIDENAKFSKFIACVRQPKSVESLKYVLGPALSKHVQIVQSESNHDAVSTAKYIILACKPYMVKDILMAPNMQKACCGKVLISICAGVSTKQIQEYLSPLSSCKVVRAMPNTASQVHQSMTVIEFPNPPLNADITSTITWIFSQIGPTTYLPSSQMNCATALCGSGPAFFALVLEAAIDGAVAMGLARDEASRMAAQTMKGTAELVLKGEHPALLKDKVTSPGGCTIGALSILEQGAVRGHVARAIREAAVIADTLGTSSQGRERKN